MAPINDKIRFRFVSFSLLGSLAAVACGDNVETPSKVKPSVSASSTTGTTATTATTATPTTPTAPTPTTPTTASSTAVHPVTPPTASQTATTPAGSGTMAGMGGIGSSTPTGSSTTPANSTTPPAGSNPAPAGSSTGTTSGSGVASAENTGAACTSVGADLKANQKLPNPFAMHDGTLITMKSQWACRRNEIKKDIEKYEVGPKQDPGKVEASISGSNLVVKITTSAGSMSLTSKITAASGSDCVAIGMNGNSSLINGCVQIPFMHDQVVFEEQNASRKKTDPFYTVYPDMWDKIGNYGAWSWGISRLIDGIEQMKDQLKVDPKKIGVQGCSYAGKMALFAGAMDERIALTIAEESGGGGITSWRTSEEFNKRTGTKVEKIDNTNYSWFLPSMQKLDPYMLPHDHHELIAMVAPRAFVTMGNQDYEWLGDESGYKSVNAAKEVWKAFGIEVHIGYDFTSNHGHCAAPQSQKDTANAFVDRFLKGKDSTKTAIYIKPQEGNFDLEYTKEIDWMTPTLQ